MNDWATSTDIESMLRSLDHEHLQAQLRLFCADCASRVLRYLSEPEFANSLEASRQFATGKCSAEELNTIVAATAELLTEHVIEPTVRDFAGSAVVDAASPHPPVKSKVWASVSCALQAVACATADSASDEDYDQVYDTAMAAESAVQCDLLRSRVPTHHR